MPLASSGGGSRARDVSVCVTIALVLLILLNADVDVTTARKKSFSAKVSPDSHAPRSHPCSDRLSAEKEEEEEWLFREGGPLEKWAGEKGVSYMGKMCCHT